MTSGTVKPLTKKTLAGFKWSTLSTLLQAALQFAIFTTLAHLLTPREFGIVGIATIFTNFIERVGFLGVGQALIQREQLSDSHIRCGFTLCLAFGLTLFAVFYVTAPLISLFFDEPQLVSVLRVISFTFLLAAIAEVSMSLLQRELNFRTLLVVTNVGYLVGNGLVGVSLAFLGFGYWSLVYAVVVSRAVRMVLALSQRPQRISLEFSTREVRELLSIGTGFSLGRLTNYCALVGDNFVTGKLLGAQALGLYSRAYQLMTAPATYFGQVLEKVLFAALSQRQNEPAVIAKFFLYGIELCSLVSIGGSLLLFVAPVEVVTVLFGPHWVEAVGAVRILALGVFFRTTYKNSDTVIRALGMVYRLAFRQTLYAVLVIGGAIIGSRWGIEGVAWAVLFAVIVNFMLLSYLCIRLLGLSWSRFGRAYLPALWVGAWQFIALEISFSLCRTAALGAFLSLACGCLVTGLVTVIVLYLAPRPCAPKVFGWLGKNVELKRFGVLGRFGQSFLLRAT